MEKRKEIAESRLLIPKERDHEGVDSGFWDSFPHYFIVTDFTTDNEMYILKAYIFMNMRKRKRAQGKIEKPKMRYV